MTTHAVQLRAGLQARATASASELRLPLALSQPTFSRALGSFGDEIAVIGRGPRTRYGLRRNVRGLGCHWPVFRITETGASQKLGELHALHQGAFWFERTLPCDWLIGEFEDGVFPDFPWFLSDLRPQGFLGRALARHIAPALLCDPDPRGWSADLTLHALLAFGSDLSGDLVLGEAALETAQKARATMVSEADFPELAARALAGEWQRSSAAGEQPKFGCYLAGNSGTNPLAVAHLVKFSPPMDTAAGRRWADLLAAEAIADHFLGGTARTVDVSNRRFLICPRFDRVGAHGRRGQISLGAVDTAYFGGLDNWAKCATRLAKAGWLSPSDAALLRLRYFFGLAIGNSDMHFGNASLVLTPNLPMVLASSYDMLPMLFAPSANGEVIARELSIPASSDDPIQAQAQILARQFWAAVMADARISKEFSRLVSGLLFANG